MEEFHVSHISLSDIKKMPLGKLSKQQIAKGFEVLEQIEVAINKMERNKLEELTNKFFTIIPHNFGRNRPPIISDDSVLQGKKEMLLVRITTVTVYRILWNSA